MTLSPSPSLSLVARLATVRLVPTAYYKPPILRALVDDDDDLALIAALEGLTNQRFKAQSHGLAALDARELAFNVWGESSINAAFAYTRAEGNRFNDAARGAWYAAFDDQTAIAEVAWHRTRELIHIDRFDDQVVYQSLLADFIGQFHDLRDAPRSSACLHSDPAIGYPAGQSLAIDLRKKNGQGIVYRSLRKPGGTCFAAFRPHVVQNVRPGARWQLTWAGSADYSVVGA